MQTGYSGTAGNSPRYVCACRAVVCRRARVPNGMSISVVLLYCGYAVGKVA